MNNNPDETYETPLSNNNDRAQVNIPVSAVRTQNLRFPKDRKDDYKQHF
jgi:hypothetical protein